MTPFVRTVEDRDELGSTSDLARLMVNDPEVDLPLLVRARRQTSGRGRGDHRWFSDAGSLTFTLAIDPDALGLRRDHEPRIALVAALGLIEAVEALGPIVPLEIRWPNDVESSGRKVAGILAERVETPQGARLLVGIGVNVATDFSSAPSDVRAMAASLRELGGPSFNADLVLATFLDLLPGLIARLARDSTSLARSWSERDALLGQTVRLAIGDEVVEGKADGIDEAGALVIVDERGPRTFFAGQVMRR
jgi:BirA family biotin operon repressor/biotin-[acetyl-CoA-carboxylase] ligase